MNVAAVRWVSEVGINTLVGTVTRGGIGLSEVGFWLFSGSGESSSGQIELNLGTFQVGSG